MSVFRYDWAIVQRKLGRNYKHKKIRSQIWESVAGVCQPFVYWSPHKYHNGANQVAFGKFPFTWPKIPQQRQSLLVDSHGGEIRDMFISVDIFSL